MGVIVLVKVPIITGSLLRPVSAAETIGRCPGLYGQSGVLQYARPAAKYLLTTPSAARTHPGKELGFGKWYAGRSGSSVSLAVIALVPRARRVSLAATVRDHPTGGMPVKRSDPV